MILAVLEFGKGFGRKRLAAGDYIIRQMNLGKGLEAVLDPKCLVWSPENLCWSQTKNFVRAKRNFRWSQEFLPHVTPQIKTWHTNCQLFCSDLRL